MALPFTFSSSQRVVLMALAGSAALHAAVIVGSPTGDLMPVEIDVPAYTAHLQPAATAEPATVKPKASKPRRRAPSPARIQEVIAQAMPPEEAAPEAMADAGPMPLEEEALSLPASQPDPPEVVALAAPMAPAPLPDLPRFDPAALPARVTILYDLNSAFADGTAEYTWSREGDRYSITGEAVAQGFFAMFLEGRIHQESHGRVTAEGLRPDTFSERRGNTPGEGLAFDWDKRTVTFQRGDATRTGALTEDTVDWLSMIFQLAHTPPKGSVLPMRVFTQRRMYAFQLKVVGVETMHLPMGNTQTLHLHHDGEKPEEAVDVWLGIDQNYLPVKMRYPIAKNRLIVEQTARRITSQ
jgi:Protein of unknown function (DUF3108)